MNNYLLISGILLCIMCIAHTVLGEKLIISPIQKTPGLPAVGGSIRLTKLTLRFAWHVTTVLGLGTAMILFYYCNEQVLAKDQIFVIRVLSVTFFVSFLVSIIGSRARHPAWIIFIVITVLTWLGTS